MAASAAPATSSVSSDPVARFGHCYPVAEISTGTVKTASGSAECDFASDWVGVAVTLYLGGLSVDSTYTECSGSLTCGGAPVSRASSSAACARTVVTYHDPLGATVQNGFSVGDACPI